MSLGTFLSSAIVEPLMLVYAAVFGLLRASVPNVGWALILFSVVLNVALLPIYYQMERAGHEAALRRHAMNEEVARIKKHFKGREQYYYIQTIHRHFGHKPLSVVFSSTELFLQILVFATVYRYISGLKELQGTEFLLIGDLSKPDGLLWGVHALPLVMTAATVASALVYTRDRTKLRNSLLLSALFLVLLYQSPSGVVLYWASNSTLSFLRNLTERTVVAWLPRRSMQRLSLALGFE